MYMSIFPRFPIEKIKGQWPMRKIANMVELRDLANNIIANIKDPNYTKMGLYSKRITIGIPTFNEEKNILKFFESLQKQKLCLNT